MKREFIVAFLFALQVALLTALVLAATSTQAATFAVAAAEDGSRIELHDEPGPCMGEARMAEWITKAGNVTPGCWLLGMGLVFVVFMDAEIARIPTGALKQPTRL